MIKKFEEFLRESHKGGQDSYGYEEILRKHGFKKSNDDAKSDYEFEDGPSTIDFCYVDPDKCKLILADDSVKNFNNADELDKFLTKIRL